jgi:hypothetical protein
MLKHKTYIDLKSEFVLLWIAEGPALLHHVLQVAFNKVHCGAEPARQNKKIYFS